MTDAVMRQLLAERLLRVRKVVSSRNPEVECVEG